MAHFKVPLFSLFLFSSCNIYNSDLEIIALLPSYEYKDNWHGDTTHFKHKDFYILKNLSLEMYILFSQKILLWSNKIYSDIMKKYDPVRNTGDFILPLPDKLNN